MENEVLQCWLFGNVFIYLFFFFRVPGKNTIKKTRENAFYYRRLGWSKLNKQYKVIIIIQNSSNVRNGLRENQKKKKLQSEKENVQAVKLSRIYYLRYRNLNLGRIIRNITMKTRIFNSIIPTIFHHHECILYFIQKNKILIKQYYFFPKNWKKNRNNSNIILVQNTVSIQLIKMNTVMFNKICVLLNYNEVKYTVT